MILSMTVFRIFFGLKSQYSIKGRFRSRAETPKPIRLFTSLSDITKLR